MDGIIQKVFNKLIDRYITEQLPTIDLSNLQQELIEEIKKEYEIPNHTVKHDSVIKWLIGDNQ